jgi:hypothetical protein
MNSNVCATPRKAEFVARVPAEVIAEVLARLAPLLGF